MTRSSRTTCTTCSTSLHRLSIPPTFVKYATSSDVRSALDAAMVPFLAFLSFDWSLEASNSANATSWRCSRFAERPEIQVVQMKAWNLSLYLAYPGTYLGAKKKREWQLCNANLRSLTKICFKHCMLSLPHRWGCMGEWLATQSKEINECKVHCMRIQIQNLYNLFWQRFASLGIPGCVDPFLSQLLSQSQIESLSFLQQLPNFWEKWRFPNRRPLTPADPFWTFGWRSLASRSGFLGCMSFLR